MPATEEASLDRWLRATVVALLIALAGTTGAVAPAAAAARVPKVALIVGPVGSITDTYRTLANEAAAEAQAAGAEVVKVYSPDATWPAVKQAVNGASIIVYLGHGNGWPSPYRNSLYPPTQNGFGLNPVAGDGDDAHQYFGEQSIARLRPAANAVVILSHLCYASGNSEPGLPEGTSGDAIQRVDNYATGFLAAGARAVVAEAWMGPAYYVRSLLRGNSSIEQIWREAPTNNGRHSIVTASTRTSGYTLRLDPRHAGSGFTRSLVSRGVTAGALRSTATGTMGITTGTAVAPAPPSLIASGVRFASTSLRSNPVAGASTRLTVPLSSGRTTSLPAGTQVSLRWDPIVLDAPPAPTPSIAPAPTPSPTATPTAAPTPSPSPTIDPNAVARFGRPNATAVPPEPTPTPAPTATPTPAPVAPDIDLVVPEQPGSIVEPAKARRGARGLSVEATYPSVPGLYRLTVTLHTPEGVVYDAPTQALLTPMLVRVAGPIAAAYGAPETLALGVDTTTTIAVKVLNAGAGRWDALVMTSEPVVGLLDPQAAAGPDPGASPEVGAAPDGSQAPDGSPSPDASTTPDPSAPADPAPSLRTTVQGAHLVATWVSAGGQPVPDPVSIQLPDAVSEPGGVADVLLALHAPATPGTYLVLLDVVTPGSGPLSSLGTDPAIIRVTVNPVATPAPSAPPVPAPVMVDQSPVAESPVASPVDPSPAVVPPDLPSPTPLLPVHGQD